MTRGTRTALAVALVIAAVSCSSEPSLNEYVADVEGLIVTMNDGLDASDADLRRGPGSLEAHIDYWERRVTLRSVFLDAFGAQTPPGEVTVLHEAALDSVTRLFAAERAFAEAAAGAGSLTAYRQLELGPLGLAVQTADEETIAICRAANDRLAETESRELFQGVLWVPDELKEVVEVAFKCTAAERAEDG